MSATHLITHRVDGNCRMPPDHSVGDECHIVGTSMYCRLHCPSPACNPPKPEPKKPTPKKSESLF